MRLKGTSPGDRTRNERGAILVFTAFALLILMGVAAIAVDLGSAWSTRRQAQAAANVAAVGALQEIPRTFASSIPPIAQDEVDALVAALSAVNTPGSPVTATVSEDFLEVFVDVDAEARNSFSRAIGAGATTTAGARATARVEIPEVDILFPVGFEIPTSQPHQCLLSSLPAYTPPVVPPDPTPRVCVSGNGSRNAVLEMARLLTNPCGISTSADAITNFHNGVDHFVDEYDPGSVRSEADACDFGHQLTLPNQADYIPLITSPGLLTSAVASGGGPLASSSPAIWEYIGPGITLPGTPDPDACKPERFADPLILEEKTQNMRSCLLLWHTVAGAPRLFTQSPGGSSFIASPRFGYGVDIDNNATSPAEYDGPVLMWFHTVIYDDPNFALDPDYSQFLSASPGPGVNVGAVTVFAIDPGMLSSSNEAALLSPYGSDLLEFFIIE